MSNSMGRSSSAMKMISDARLFLLVAHALVYDVSSTLYMDDYCGRKITSAGDRLQSQKAGYYDNDMDCEVTIQTPAGFDFFVLEFEWLDMETSPSGMPTCYDFVEVYDGYSSFYSELVLRKCSAHVPNVTSSGDMVTLRMRTDESTVSAGFALIFTAYHTGPCFDDVDHYSCSSGDVCIHSSLVCDCHKNCPDGDDEMCNEPCSLSNEENHETEMSALAVACITVAALLVLASAVIVAVYAHRQKNDICKVQPETIDVITTPRTVVVDNMAMHHGSTQALIAPPTPETAKSSEPANPGKSGAPMTSSVLPAPGEYVDSVHFQPLFEPTASQC